MDGMPALVGRDREREALLTAARGQHRAVTIEGVAGVGKSALFTELSRQLAAEGVRVLAARPTEGEAELPYSGLADILAPVTTAVAELSAPLRTALDQALLRCAGDEPVERHAVCRATTAVLAALGTDRRTVVAVDDLPWIDAPSAAALAFAARRIDPGQVSFLVTIRTEDDAGTTRVLGLDDVDVTRHRLGPLDRHDLGQLVFDRTGVALSTPRLAELHDLTGGVPLHALEVALAAGLDGIAGREPLVVPDGLAAVIEQRLAGLSGEARQVALAVAFAGSLDPDVARRSGTEGGLDEAVAAGVLAVDGTELVRCAHPMFASVLTSAATPWQRRAMHRRLAEQLGDESRWLHVALGAEEADDAVAGQLEAAAERHSSRAAHETAARLAEAAVELTSGDLPGRQRRMAAAARYHLLAGDAVRAQRVLTELVDEMEPGSERAQMLVLLADTVGDDVTRSIEITERALDDAALHGGDPAQQSECHAMLEMLHWLAGDGERSAHHCRMALEYAEASGDDGMIALALTEWCHLQLLRDCRYDEASMDRAVSLEPHVFASVPRRPSSVRALLATYLDLFDEARPVLAQCRDMATQEGDEAAIAAIVFRQSELELRAGRWPEALDLARRFVVAARQATTEYELSIAQSHLALVAAHLGLVDEADREGRAGLELATAGGYRAVETRARGALGMLALSSGDAASARELLTPAQAALDELGQAEVSIHHVTVNLLDALVLEGELAGARALASRVTDVGRSAGRAWHTTVGERTLARIAAAEGDLARALEHAAAAVTAADRCRQPFERARTLLAVGEVQRRARRWGDARTSLGAALELFDSLGAPRWAERATGELGRIAGRAPASDDGLTATEQRIAELVAAGKTNREVAAELFVSVRTVESNLTRIYAKLGLRGRAELVAHIHQR